MALSRLIKLEKQRGSPNVKALITEKYKRFALPFSTIILTVLAVSLSLRARNAAGRYKHSRGHSAYGRISFHAEDIRDHGGKGTDGYPLFWIWLPNIIFAVIAYYTYKNAKK